MKHLLILRFSAMGDVALLTPVVEALAQRYPDTKITLVTRAKLGVFFAQFSNVHVVQADFSGAHNGFPACCVSSGNSGCWGLSTS